MTRIQARAVCTAVPSFVSPEVEEMLTLIKPLCDCLTRRTTHDRSPACATRIKAFQVIETVRCFAA